MDEADLLRKVSALLTKAEGTDNEHEAATFFEKAHDMMVRYAIDEARVREAQRKGNRPVEEPIVLDYMFSSYAHHREAKTDLLMSVAKHNSVNCYVHNNQKGSNYRRVEKAGLTNLHESQWARLIGYKTDIEMAKLLYLSLVVQATRFATEDYRLRYGEAKRSSWEDGQVGKFTWVGNHMDGFAVRIGRRLQELTEGIYVSMAGANDLMIDKWANILEWMYEQGLARRPSTTPYVYKCYTLQPETDPGWPLTLAGKPNKKHRAKYCVIPLPGSGQPHEGPHNYTEDPGRSYTSYYVTKGRRESYEAGQLGRSAADRADIGITRVGNQHRQLR